MPTLNWIGKDATVCRLGAPRLQREQIVFKQTPYALAV